MHTHAKGRKWFLFKISMVILFAVLFSFLVMLLWNWLMPEIFGLKTLSFLQAAGLLVLSKIIFSGFGRGHHGHHWHRRTGGQSVPDAAGNTNPDAV
ncbi:MAG: hypothetical protein ACM3Q2_16205 [Syntrophothermus sp.]